MEKASSKCLQSTYRKKNVLPTFLVKAEFSPIFQFGYGRNDLKMFPTVALGVVDWYPGFLNIVPTREFSRKKFRNTQYQGIEKNFR